VSEQQQEDLKSSALIEMRDLVVHFSLGGRALKRDTGKVVHAVDGVSLAVFSGETLALVGESGSGKTTLGLALLLLYRPTRGSVLFEGKDLWTMKGKELKKLKRYCQVVFQDPASSLDPRMTIKDIVTEPLKAIGGFTDEEYTNRAVESLRLVGLESSDILDKYPHQFSGGQKQRIGIARAVITTPKFVVLDEPTSALDVSVQAQILNLLKAVQEEYGLSYLLITHNIDVAKYMSDRIAVMYAGKVVELGGAQTIIEHSRHPYTVGLINSVPELGSDTPLHGIPGDVTSATSPPPGCRFNPRCPLAQDICKTDEPLLREIEPSHWTACHFAESVGEP
jgi:oligopeptide/dipeptide ABC transporter ATP-binding protein